MFARLFGRPISNHQSNPQLNEISETRRRNIAVNDAISGCLTKLRSETNSKVDKQYFDELGMYILVRKDEKGNLLSNGYDLIARALFISELANIKELQDVLDEESAKPEDPRLSREDLEKKRKDLEKKLANSGNKARLNLLKEERICVFKGFSQRMYNILVAYRDALTLGEHRNEQSPSSSPMKRLGFRL